MDTNSNAGIPAKASYAKAIKWTLFAIIYLLIWGEGIPYLVSANSDILLICGVVLCFLMIVLPVVYFFNRRKQIAAYFNRNNNTTILLTAVLFLISACHKVPPGNVGVKVKLNGGDKGVQLERLSPGRYSVGVNTDIYDFPTWQQNYSYTRDTSEEKAKDESFTFQSIEGLGISADIGVTFYIPADSAVRVFQQFREGISDIEAKQLKNIIRDQLNERTSSLPAEQIYGPGKRALMDSVEAGAKHRAAAYGIVIEKVYLIGKFHMSPKITEAIESKIAATQLAEQRKNEIAEAEASGSKLLATAKAEAEANSLKAKSLTPELLKWEELQNQRLSIQRWNGISPSTLYYGATGTTPSFLLPMK